MCLFAERCLNRRIACRECNLFLFISNLPFSSQMKTSAKLQTPLGMESALTSLSHLLSLGRLLFAARGLMEKAFTLAPVHPFERKYDFCLLKESSSGALRTS